MTTFAAAAAAEAAAEAAPEDVAAAAASKTAKAAVARQIDAIRAHWETDPAFQSWPRAWPRALPTPGERKPTPGGEWEVLANVHDMTVARIEGYAPAAPETAKAVALTRAVCWLLKTPRGPLRTANADLPTGADGRIVAPDGSTAAQTGHGGGNDRVGMASGSIAWREWDADTWTACGAKALLAPWRRRRARACNA